jgi:peptide/nickel transport system substrate-binding protein
MRSIFPRAILIAAALAAGCSGTPWNYPYSNADRNEKILYSVFVDRPKHLDPAQSYTTDEAVFTRQIYEPPLQYHYLRRPYELIPLTAVAVPRPRTTTRGGATYSVYEIRIKPGIHYQPHPAFNPAHLSLSRSAVAKLRSPYDLPGHTTRELLADDYIYQIKRLAHPHLHSPIFGLMSEYIVGLKEYAERLKKAAKPGEWLDLRSHPLEGVERVNSHTYRVTLKGSYPQFVYWLAMPFFAPMPWEADRFFSQEGMAAKNFTLDWWPVGTGPYMLAQNNPNARMVLERNPNFRGELYPSEGEPGDKARGLLDDAGKMMPFIDRAVFVREKEAIPLWNKFLQGYYDTSGIQSDTFDQAVRISVEGEANLTPEMEQRGISLRTSIAATIFYLGVNWLDPVLGGNSERARKLRHALAIAMDWEEYLSIFLNGRGVPSHSPLAPGIFGYREGKAGINPVAYEWRDGRERRRSLEQAKKLLAEAGYPNGRDARTGAPMVLYLDTVSRGPGDKSRLDWWRKQFDQLSIQLEIRETDWNRFQEKLRKGTTQLFIVGWSADYPDPENFMFLLHGPQSRARNQGENASNYVNSEFDALFERMRNMPNSPERQKIIDRMTEIFRYDAPWIGGFHPKNYSLSHGWLANNKPSEMTDAALKYWRVDPARRAALRKEWNTPVVWPILLALGALVAALMPAVVSYRRRERQAARRAA